MTDNSDRNLNERFRVFMRGLPGAECIDDLPLTPEQTAGKRADYFLAARSVILEVKSAVEDMQEKLRAVLAPHMKQPDWPVFYGKADIGPYLERHPRGEDIKREMYEAATTALTEQFESANRQLRSTKATFGLPSSLGLMVYLNDQVEVVAPQVIIHRISSLFKKRTADGAYRYPEIEGVLVLSETHFVVHPDGPMAPVILAMRRNEGDVPEFRRVCDELVQAWARWTGTVLTPTEFEDLDVMSKAIHPNRILQELHRFPAKSHEVWVREYPLNRHYKRLDRSRLFQIGAEVFSRLGAAALKNSKKKLTPAEAAPLLEQFTWFLEELKLRGIGVQEWMAEYRELIHASMQEISGLQVDRRANGGGPKGGLADASGKSVKEEDE